MGSEVFVSYRAAFSFRRLKNAPFYVSFFAVPLPLPPSLWTDCIPFLPPRYR